MNTKKQRIVNYLTRLDDNRTAERVAELVVQWCYDKFGPSKYSPFIPDVSISTEDDTNLLGEYVSDDNEIILYWSELKNKRNKLYETIDLIVTIIHEYQHYLQDPKWYSRYLNMLTLKEKDNGSHPYELHADRVALAKWNECFHDTINKYCTQNSENEQIKNTLISNLGITPKNAIGE